MKRWLQERSVGIAAWLVIAGLVLGGLGWATGAALRLEEDQRTQHAAAEQAAILRLAMWRLDSRISPLLSREDGRPYQHFSAVFAVPLAFTNQGRAYPQGAVLELSPLLQAEPPEWMLLHFQANDQGWQSPQVLAEPLRKRLQQEGRSTATDRARRERKLLLAKLQREISGETMLACAREHARPVEIADTTVVLSPVPTQQLLAPPAEQFAANQGPLQQQMAQQPEYNVRAGQQMRLANEAQSFNSQRVQRDLAENNSLANGANWLSHGSLRAEESVEVLIHMTPLAPVWLEVGRQDLLLLLRLVRIGASERCQGILLDAEKLQQMLASEVADLFPQARLVPMRDATPTQPERTMTALPLQLDPGPQETSLPAQGWTPLRIGLSLAWLAALVALTAVGLGGWSLLALSERRMRFVWAVTHELRTPLTTLRLYLDMLHSGMVREEQQRTEYIATLNTEANRLHNLIRNVLAFARLERQSPSCPRALVRASDILQHVQAAWEGRCQEAGKHLIVELNTDDDATVWTDTEMVQQVLANLIENACKYSRDAADPGLWVRARAEGKRTVFEVEDRGPGVCPAERRAIFRAFRRGREADVRAGGVGLGLALAQRWTRLLGGRLSLQPPGGETGALFRLELPSNPAQKSQERRANP